MVNLYQGRTLIQNCEFSIQNQYLLSGSSGSSSSCSTSTPGKPKSGTTPALQQLEGRAEPAARQVLGKVGQIWEMHLTRVSDGGIFVNVRIVT